jgi:hypothetical protein
MVSSVVCFMPFNSSRTCSFYSWEFALGVGTKWHSCCGLRRGMRHAAEQLRLMHSFMCLICYAWL